MSKGIILKTDGSEEPTDDLSLKGLQKAVDGNIEIIRFTVPYEGWDVAYVNEEGRLGSLEYPTGLPYNEKASEILMLVAAQYGGVFDIRGDVVLSKKEYGNE